MPNVSFKITMADITAVRVSTALCALYGYQPVVTNPLTGEQENNPESAQDFAFRKQIEHLKELIVALEAKDLSKADKVSKIAEVNSLSITMEVI